MLFFFIMQIFQTSSFFFFFTYLMRTFYISCCWESGFESCPTRWYCCSSTADLSVIWSSPHPQTASHRARARATGLAPNKTDVGLMRVNDCWNRFRPIWNQINGPNLILVRALAGKWLVTPETLLHVKAQSGPTARAHTSLFKMTRNKTEHSGRRKPERVSFS